MVIPAYMPIQEVLGNYFEQGIGAGKPYEELHRYLLEGGFCKPIPPECKYPFLYPFNPARFINHVYRVVPEQPIETVYGYSNPVAYWVGYVYTALYAYSEYLGEKRALDDIVSSISPEFIANAFYPLHEAGDAKLYDYFIGQAES